MYKVNTDLDVVICPHLLDLLVCHVLALLPRLDTSPHTACTPATTTTTARRRPRLLLLLLGHRHTLCLRRQVQDAGFRVHSSGFRVDDFGTRFWG
jgi:hypothetical protein